MPPGDRGACGGWLWEAKPPRWGAAGTERNAPSPRFCAFQVQIGEQRHQFNVALKGGDGPTEEVTVVRAGPRGPD